MEYTAGALDEDRREPMHAFAELALTVVDAAPPEQTLRRVADLAKLWPGLHDIAQAVVEAVQK